MDHQWISYEYHQVMIQNGQVSDPQETRCQDHHLLQWQLAPFTMIESWHMPQKAKPRWDYQHVLDVWNQQEYWQGPWKCIPGKSRSRWKPKSYPEEAKSRLPVAVPGIAAVISKVSHAMRVKLRWNPAMFRKWNNRLKVKFIQDGNNSQRIHKI